MKLERFEFVDEIGMYFCVFLYHVDLSLIIMRFEMEPEFTETIDIQCFWTDDELFEFEEFDEFIRLGTVGDHEKWDLMHAGKYSGMETHTDDSIECRIDLQCLFDRSRDIILFSFHDPFDKHVIILVLIS